MKWIKNRAINEGVVEKIPALIEKEVIVEQVHNDFKSIQDELIRCFQDKLENVNEETIERQKRLSKFGFTNTPQSEIASKEMGIKLKNNELKTIKETYEYFKQKYPLNKWISHESAIELCKKYGLVLGDTERFISDVPEKNLRDIEDFKFNEEDGIYCLIYHGKYSSDRREVSFNEYKNNTRVDYFHYGEVGFKIIALQKDFDMRGMELNGGEIVPKIQEDPIVLKPVWGKVRGYLIVTAWGDEALDPIVSNQINN